LYAASRAEQFVLALSLVFV